MEYAIIYPNTLLCLGLEQLLREFSPTCVVRSFSDFPSFADDTPDMYARYFVSSQTYALYNPFFLARKEKTILLLHDTTVHALPANTSVLKLESSRESLAKDLSALLAEQRTSESLEGSEHELSLREIEVLVLVCKGLINKEIADKLCISLTTVITHRKNITEKLGIKSVSGLTIYAVMNGYIAPDSI